MKTIYLFAIVIAIVFQSKNGFSQKSGFLKVQFDVTDSVKNPIDNPTITLFEGNNELQKLNSNHCTFKLDLNKTYTVEVSANTYSSKTILFDTKVSEADLIYKYDLRVVLLHRILPEKSVTKICYDEKVKCFDFFLK